MDDYYYEVDVNSDGKLDLVMITQDEDGTPYAVADVDSDGRADYALSIDELIEYMEVDSQVRMASVWSGIPKDLDPEDYETKPTY